MSAGRGLYPALLMIIALGFAAAFVIAVMPAVLAETDPLRFVTVALGHPYTTGYMLDAICCWLVLAVWVVHEARHRNVRHGWIALLLGVVPGVATGFAVYLLMRSRQLGGREG